MDMVFWVSVRRNDAWETVKTDFNFEDCNRCFMAWLRDRPERGLPPDREAWSHPHQYLGWFTLEELEIEFQRIMPHVVMDELEYLDYLCGQPLPLRVGILPPFEMANYVAPETLEKRLEAGLSAGLVTALADEEQFPFPWVLRSLPVLRALGAGTEVRVEFKIWW